ncbi:MAG: chitin disaccharide deacetylase [Erysipelotrichaceae bacterium]|nr:chitin disaccharide deacetylase [Solobacterium sp.]MDO5121275.1 chitin disaccharide deacetylase [Erysipelotrichaceae bacterium]
MKLIMNADDLGYTLGNTYGIIDAYKNGIVRSTTAMCNENYIEKAAELVKDCPDLGVGVHLVLSSGRPLTENRTLTDENGVFFKSGEVKVHEFDSEEIYREWKAQIERFIVLFGRMPTHIDSHHHVHTFTDQLTGIAKQLGKEYGLELRKYGPYRFVSEFYRETVTEECLFGILEKYRDEDIEIMCHPGYCDRDLYTRSSYALDRVREVELLCRDSVKQYLKDHNIESCHY